MKLFLFVVLLLVFGGFLFFFSECGIVIFLVVFIMFFGVTVWFFFKDLVVYILIRYIFDTSDNAVYQSNLLFRKRKMMNLDEVIISKAPKWEAGITKWARRKVSL